MEILEMKRKNIGDEECLLIGLLVDSTRPRKKSENLNTGQQTIEISQTKTQREKRVKETKQSRTEHSDLWDNIK